MMLNLPHNWNSTDIAMHTRAQVARDADENMLREALEANKARLPVLLDEMLPHVIAPADLERLGDKLGRAGHLLGRK